MADVTVAGRFSVCTMKRALLYFCFPRRHSSRTNHGHPFPSPQSAAHAWPEDYEHLNAILPGMKLAPGVINKEGALLTPRATPQASGGRFSSATFPWCPKNPRFQLLHPAVPNYLLLAVIFEELKLPMGPYVTATAFGKARLRELQTAD